MRIILASKSPRRKELLGRLYSDFEIITKETDETLPEGVHPREGVAILAERKGKAVFSELCSRGEDLSDALIISSDTLVELFGEALGKPSSAEDACRMLKELSGKAHNVHTGISVCRGGRFFSATDSTEVVFRELTDEEIEGYVRSGEPMDKAGSYAIQGGGGKFVTEINGDFDTVVGLSVRLLSELIEKALFGGAE